MKMRKVWRSMLIMALFLVALAMAVPAQAAGSVQTTEYCTVYSRKNVDRNIKIVESSKRKRSFKSLKSSNKRVAVLKVKKRGSYYYLCIVSKKPGRAKLTYTINGTNYTINAVVRKYSNPIASIRIGKTKISSGKFKNRTYTRLKYSKFRNKRVKVSIRLKKNWVLGYCYNDIGKIYGQGNFSYYRANRKSSAVEDKPNGSTIRITGGKGSTIWVSAYNTKTKVTELISVYFD